MKYVSRELKGSYLYIKRQTIFEIIKTVILFLMAFGIYLIGYLTLKTNKSLWSIFAVLAMLPAAKSLVGVIMFLRYRSLPADLYNKFEEIKGNIPALYENIITTEKKSYFLPCICLYANTIISYSECKNSKDVKSVNEHLENVLKAGGHKGFSIKVYDNEESFLARLKQMRENLSEDEKLLSTEAIFTTIKAVSL